MVGQNGAWMVVVALLASCSDGKRGAKDASPTPGPTTHETRDAATTGMPTRVVITDRSSAGEIRDMATFRGFANQPGGVVRSGEVIKFLIDNRGYPDAVAPVHYINGNYTAGGPEPVSWVALHREWAEKEIPGFVYSLKKFSKTAYFTRSLEKRDFISGRIQTFEKDGAVFLAAWFIEMDLIHEEMIQFAFEQLQRTFSIPGEPLHLVAYSTHQTTKTIEPWLEKNGIEVHQLSDLLADVPFRALNVGEAWGTLRVAPPDSNELSPTDIPLFEVLPLDLAVVAGTITTAFQDVASHVNIKAKQRKTPNLMLRDPDAIKRLKALADKPIHLTVREDGYDFELTTEAIVKAKLEALLAKQPWRMPPRDLAGAPISYDEMCRDEPPLACLERSTRFGGKAAGLGFLAHRDVIGIGSKTHKKLGYRLTPLGFAVPISAYKQFVDWNGERDPAFKARLEKLMNAERGLEGAALSSTEQRRLIEEIQASFMKAPLPPRLLAALEGQLEKLRVAYAARYPGEKLETFKVRSSANVEDIPSFNGAGLHNSYSAKLSTSRDKSHRNKPCELAAKRSSKKTDVKLRVSPRTLECAVKATYASLWNLRAVRERTFRRFDHRGALMGLAIVPSYKHAKKSKRGAISANSVLLTRVLNTSTVYGYQLSTQKGGNLVTNPTPGTLAELATLTFQLASTPAATVLQFAKPKASKPQRDKPILSNKTMRTIVAIARATEEAYCRARPDYFLVNGKRRKCHQISNSQSKPSALDMELKIYKNGEILFKQVREFDGR